MNIRQDIQGTSPQDLNKMNENFMAMWQKVYGNIDFADGNNNLKQRIMTQYQTVQSEGNLDSSYPLYIRFYVPPNVKSVKSAPLNVMVEHYRMDSSVAKSGGQIENVDIAMGIGTSNVGVTGLAGGDMTREVDYWGTGNIRVTAPLDFIYPNNDDMLNATETFDMPYGYGYVTSNDNRKTLGTIVMNGMMKGSSQVTPYVDLNAFQHQHYMPPHNHEVIAQPHSHNATGKVSLAPHQHTLNEGIKISGTSPQNVEVFVNSVKVGSTLSGISSMNNVEIKDYIITGEWNVIKVSTSNLARVVLYGIVELINNY